MLKTFCKRRYYKFYWQDFTSCAEVYIKKANNHRTLLQQWCPFFHKPFAAWIEHENLKVLQRNSDNEIELAIVNLPAFDKEFLSGPKGEIYFIFNFLILFLKTSQ